MKPYRYALPVLFFVAWIDPATAQDINGYTSEYECRAGGLQCNVDVIGLAAQSCQQIIEPGASWDSIDWNNNVICLRAGDHSAQGRLFLQSSGTASNRKVLRCVTASGGQCPDPKPGQVVTAKIRKLFTNGAQFWVVDRLDVDGNGASGYPAVHISGANTTISHDIVFSRMWVHHHQTTGFSQELGGLSSEASHRIHIQNSIVHHMISTPPNIEAQCIDGNMQNSYIVNNELYDCNKPISVGSGIQSVMGTVVENNDLYLSPAGRTNCNGAFDPNGACSIIEGLMSVKAGGTAELPYRFIHNRLWGGRQGDGAILGESSGFGGCASLSASDEGRSHYVLFQDNICMDSAAGVVGFSGADNNQSVVGNIIYKIHQMTPEPPVGLAGNNKKSSEYYLNTIIDADYWFTTWNSAFGSHGEPTGTNDFRCNVAISSGPRHPDTSPPFDTQVDNNVFYGTPVYTANGDSNNLSNALSVRQNNTFYAEGSILRTSTNPDACTTPVDNDTDCFLYRVITGGTSAGTSPGYCTTLGCTTTDGGMTVRAIRGPYTFHRRLKTGPEKTVIPYAAVDSSAPEVDACLTSTGSRPGIGITNDMLSNGVLFEDRDGTDRNQTAGALEAGSGGGGGGNGGGDQTPYGNTARIIPGLIEAEHFDEGGQGIAYDDTTPGNEGAAFRSTGVDLESSSENGYNIGWTQPGEWVEFTVNVDATGDYRIDVRVASAGPGGVLHIEVDGMDVTGPLTVPDTGGWQNWQTLTRDGVNLTEGRRVLRLAFDAAGATGDVGNVNYINVAPAGGSPCNTPYGDAINIPGTIEAEHYDLGGENCAYHDTTPENEPGAFRTDGVDVFAVENDGGLYAVGWVTPGEWLKYSVDVAQAGTYTLEVRYATQGFGGTMHIEFNDQNKAGSIALPDTGGWQTWGTVSVPVTLNAGQQIMRLAFDTGNNGWLANINYIRITAGTPQPTLSGSLATPPAVVNLTTEGTVDWVHWGLIDETSVNRKSGVTPVLGNYTVIGTSPVQRYDDNPSGFTWSDGTPTASVTNTPTYLYVTGVGNGFEYSLPADTTLRTVQVYVGVWAAQGQITATLSDNSASPYSDNSLINTTDHTHGVYTFQYRAASPGQSLVIRWIATENYHQYGSMTWQAATVGGG